MVDAAGKPGSNILLGNKNWAGSYSECKLTEPYIMLNKTIVQPFKPQFCTVGIGNPATGGSAVPGLVRHVIFIAFNDSIPNIPATYK